MQSWIIAGNESRRHNPSSRETFHLMQRQGHRWISTDMHKVKRTRWIMQLAKEPPWERESLLFSLEKSTACQSLAGYVYLSIQCAVSIISARYTDYANSGTERSRHERQLFLFKCIHVLFLKMGYDLKKGISPLSLSAFSSLLDDWLLIAGTALNMANPIYSESLSL